MMTQDTEISSGESTPKKSGSRHIEGMANSESDVENQNIVVPVEVITENKLTQDEQKERLRLERVIERSFYEAGKALQQLRDRKLFRSTHKSFEEYCKDRFGYNRSRSYQYIDAATVVDNLQKCPQIVDIFPTAESQVRPLTKLEVEEQWEAWQRSVEVAGDKVPSARIVKDVVESIMERTKVPNPYRVGEVCQILPKDNPELKGKGGCWCIVTSVGECSCTIATWDSECVVKLEHIKSFDYLEEECAFMGELRSRLAWLQSCGNLDAAAYWMMNGIGKLSCPYLTPIQEKLLGVLEVEYGVG